MSLVMVASSQRGGEREGERGRERGRREEVKAKEKMFSFSNLKQ